MGCDLAEYLGYAAAAYLGLRLGVCLLTGLYRRFLCAPTDVKKLGRWAVVTGSTDGIGKAYAQVKTEKT